MHTRLRPAPVVVIALLFHALPALAAIDPDCYEGLEFSKARCDKEGNDGVMD